MSAYDYFSVTQDDVYYYGNTNGGPDYSYNRGVLTGVTVSVADAVPAPGAPALLGLGLIGVGGLRRRATKAI